jgi:hypothetical protein
MHAKTAALLLFGMLFSIPAQSQLVEEFDPPESSCCLPIFARRLVDQLEDWNQLSRYKDANQELKKKPHDPKRVLFMGDSITDFWSIFRVSLMSTVVSVGRQRPRCWFVCIPM